MKFLGLVLVVYISKPIYIKARTPDIVSERADIEDYYHKKDGCYIWKSDYVYSKTKRKGECKE